MKVDSGLLEQRRRLGLDRKDEMWEGVLHMAPSPANEHQRICDELLVFLTVLFRRTGRGTIRSSINVFDETSPLENYRIPDLTFVAAGREALFAQDGLRGGGPDAVIEVRSPNDESYEKLPFFARLGVSEVIIVDRDTKRVEVFRLGSEGYQAAERPTAGDVLCDVLGVWFRAIGDAEPRLRVGAIGEPDLDAVI